MRILFYSVIVVAFVSMSFSTSVAESDQPIRVEYGKPGAKSDAYKDSLPGVEYRKQGLKIDMNSPIPTQLRKIGETQDHIMFLWPIDKKTSLRVWAPWSYQLDVFGQEHGLYTFEFRPKLQGDIYQKYKDKFPNLRSDQQVAGLKVEYNDALFRLEEKPVHVGIEETYRRVLQRLANRGTVKFDANMKIDKVQTPSASDRTMIFFVDFPSGNTPGMREIIGSKIMNSGSNIWLVQYSMRYSNESGTYNAKSYGKLKADILKELNKNKLETSN